ncbi:MAG: PilZ domain-containing protein [Candidatus Omnitrophica bacterium]|nr:PilZ domain-containing protein [Candidatus Omnitrophota bacterium]
MDEERRRSPRIKKTLAVLYSRCGETGQNNQTWNMTSVQNISGRGMRIVTNEEFPIGETLIFRLKIPSRPFEWQEIKGKIAGVEQLKTSNDEPVAGQYIARIEFIETRDDQKWHIEEYIRWFLEQSGGE